MSPAPSRGLADLQRVLDDELEYIIRNRHSDETIPHDANRDIVRRSLVGLAMSGGGIRSATTNLGILQALAGMRILQMVDYVSTVSGGGYIGACLSSLLSWNHNAARQSPDLREPFTFAPDEKPAFSTEPQTFPFRSDYSPSRRDVQTRARRGPVTGSEDANRPDRVGPHPRTWIGIVAHLHTHGNLLIAHTGLFHREALRGIGALTIGGVYNSLGFVVTLIAASAIYLLFILGVAPVLPTILSGRTVAVSVDTARRQVVPVDSSIVRTHQQVERCPRGSADCVTAIATTLHSPGIRDRIGRNLRVVDLVLAPWRVTWTPADAGSTSLLRNVPVRFRPLLLALVLGIISLSGIAFWTSRVLRAYLRGNYGSIESDPGDSVEDVFERRVLQRSALLLAAAVVAAVGAGQNIWGDSLPEPEQIVWIFVPLAVLSGAWLASFAANAVILPWKGWTRRSRSLNSAFYAIVSWGWWAMLAVALAPLAIYALREQPLQLGVGTVGSLVLSRFLAGKTPGGSRFSLSPKALRIVLGVVVLLVLTLGGLFFATLLSKYFVTWQTAAIGASIASAIFVGFGWVANHNKVGPQYFYRDRLSETYLFSELPDEDGRLRVFRDAMEMPLDCLHGRPRDEGSKWRNPAPYHLISAAINLAGSRDLTRKDRKSGYWLFSKLFCGSTHTGFRETLKYRGGGTKLAEAISISGAAASSGIGKDTFFAQAAATVLFNIRLGSWLENPAYESSITRSEKWVFWPLYLFREVTMATDESQRLVNLSDGGHTGDNIGIYPLLQRRCKIIIACDSERDPRLTFGSFTEVLRHAYIDMGIDVDIDLTMIRPDSATGLSRTHCAVGRIRYPDRPDQESVLIYLKNSLMGDEPEPVLNYKTTCPDFPHETTADQFFDDAQFESYRALGVHIAEHTFEPWVRDPLFKTALEHHAARGVARV